MFLAPVDPEVLIRLAATIAAGVESSEQAPIDPADVAKRAVQIALAIVEAVRAVES